jgi:hypothetical protein
MISSAPAKRPLFLNLQKIKTLTQLHRALKHNKREIANELGVGGHIDQSKSHLNYALTKPSNSFDAMRYVHHRITAYQKQVCKTIRHDAIVAIEVVFSVSATTTGIDLHQYFSDCFTWSLDEFAPASVLSADVHLDEANPHLHVIFLCVTETRLIASQVAGNKRKFHDRREDFYLKVAKKYGLELPPPALSRIQRTQLAERVLDEFSRTIDPLTKSQHYPAICNAVRQNPVPFANQLNLEPGFTPPKKRTLTQFFTSRRRGKDIPKTM